eukprot:gene10422-11514_t
MSLLETVLADTSFEGNQISTSAGLAECFQTKQYVATAYLFREVFAITGPLSRYLQSVDIDFGKAISMIDSAVARLATLRGKPEKILESIEQDFNPAEVAWKITRTRNRKLMDGEQMRDDPALTALDYWKRETFYVAMDKVSMGMEKCFKKSQPLLRTFSLFAPSRFPQLLQQYTTSCYLQEALQEFSETYKLDFHSCADELFSFFKTFSKFNCVCPNDDEGYSANDVDDNGDDDDSLESLNDGEAHTEAEMTGNAGKETTGIPTDQKRDKQQRRMRPPSFINALVILCHPEYMLIHVDAYPTLCQVYAIAVAVPVAPQLQKDRFLH